MKEHIKCCPFCGSHEVEIARTNDRACWVACHNCDGQSTAWANRKDAIAAWNRRFLDDVSAEIVYDGDKEYTL